MVTCSLDCKKNCSQQWCAFDVAFRNKFTCTRSKLNTRFKSCKSILIGQARYIKILTWLRGFLGIFLYLVWFSLCSIPFWELWDNGLVKNLQIILTLKPPSHVKFIELGLLPSCTGYSILEAKVHFILQVNVNLAKALNTVPWDFWDTILTNHLLLWAEVNVPIYLHSGPVILL